MGSSRASQPKSSGASAKEMRSRVNWSLLGLVISRPSYGMELARRFERVYGDVLRLSSDSHVYSALDALRDRGLVRIAPGKGGERQPKPHYQATAEGVRGYVAWLVEQVDAERRSRELWVRQLAVFADDPAVALRVLGLFESEYAKGSGSVGRLPPGTVSDERMELIDDLVAEHNRLVLGSMFSWLSYARSRFQTLAGRGDGAA